MELSELDPLCDPSSRVSILSPDSVDRTTGTLDIERRHIAVLASLLASIEEP